MDPHLLRTYVSVARLASFSAAARELGYTQSAVSQHVAALEADLGMPLLGRRPVAPTPAGERLLEHAASLLLRLDAARADLARFAAPPRETLTLAAAPLALHPRVLAALPATGVTVRTLPRDEVPAAVATGAADLGLVDGLAAPSDPLRLPDVAPVTARPVAEEGLVVALPANHPLASRATSATAPATSATAPATSATAPAGATTAPATSADAGTLTAPAPGLVLADLVDARWLDAPDAGFPLDRLRAVHGAPAGRGFRAALRYEGTDARTLTALAAAGHGLALLPASAAGLGVPGAVFVPLAAPRLVHRTELLHAGREPAGPAAELVRRLGPRTAAGR
ncbi:LysR family transcriptional regulator [Streptomyces roseicoloratus]|uniref:LysR family transcriptional regulator n=1 Tax=Streptomyces roseicoloratus TaxID=2508722 RepID=A0ABY9RQG7_9ACTN|nr:LysR family transcriptional regulator [Streptomyces roseicoloratus]WMX44436.1 LysR family transcriptional regulator [Streptomyces roseicoloratus]